MSDPLIREQLIDELYRGPVTVPRDGALRDVLGWAEYSKNAVCRAMGRLITDGLAVRCRAPMEYIGHSDRPVTYHLKR